MKFRRLAGTVREDMEAKPPQPSTYPHMPMMGAPAQTSGQSPAPWSGQPPAQMTGQAPAPWSGQPPAQMSGYRPAPMSGQVPAQYAGPLSVPMTSQPPALMTGYGPTPMVGQSRPLSEHVGEKLPICNQTLARKRL